MAEVKEIHITPEADSGAGEAKERTFAERVRDLGAEVFDSLTSEIKKEIAERITSVADTAGTLASELTQTAEAMVKSAREQYETEREELLQAEIERQVETATQHLHEEHKSERERLLRTAADAENSKKRMESDYQRRLEYANQEILEGIIPVLDSLEAAIKSVPESEESVTPAATLTEGVKLVQKQLLDALKTHGLTPIEAVGKTYNPNQHEGLVTTPSAEVPEGQIISEFRRGYMLHARVLRAAQVIVSQGPPEEEASGGDAMETPE